MSFSVYKWFSLVLGTPLLAVSQVVMVALDGVTNGVWSGALCLMWSLLHRVLVGGLVRGPIASLITIIQGLIQGGLGGLGAILGLLWEVGAGGCALGRQGAAGVAEGLVGLHVGMAALPGEVATCILHGPPLVGRGLGYLGETMVAFFVGIYHFGEEVVWKPVILVLWAWAYPFVIIWTTCS